MERSIVTVTIFPVADPELWFAGGDMASAGARAYNGGLAAEPQRGFKGQSPGGGASPLKPTRILCLKQ